MATPDHLWKLRTGAAAWREWRRLVRGRVDLRFVDLSGSDLRNFDLHYVNFNLVTLDNADLSGADLSKANLYGAQARGAKLRDATLDDANCRRASLEGADLTGAQLVQTDFTRASLRGARLTNATIGGSIFAQTDLRDVVGLDTIRHDGPSTIGLDTLSHAAGLPAPFLRGCGAPDAFIEYATSLFTKPIEYYTCFLSYSSQDDEFVRRLHADLQTSNVRTWFAPEDLKVGDRFRSRIEESIRLFDKLVLIVSEHSIDSPWVAREVEAALDREDRERRDVLFPIRLDDSLFTCENPWVSEVRRSRHVGDFSHWKNYDSYVVSLQRLVQHLKRDISAVIR